MKIVERIIDWILDDGERPEYKPEEPIRSVPEPDGPSPYAIKKDKLSELRERDYYADGGWTLSLMQQHGIPHVYLIHAFLNVTTISKGKSIEVCAWAMQRAEGDPDRAGDLVIWWAMHYG